MKKLLLLFAVVIFAGCSKEAHPDLQYCWMFHTDWRHKQDGKTVFYTVYDEIICGMTETEAEDYRSEKTVTEDRVAGNGEAYVLDVKVTKTRIDYPIKVDESVIVPD